MELINSTRMVAGYTVGMDPSGREFLVIVIKGTFSIPTERGAPLRLHEEQVPLVVSDVFYGEPGLSAPKYEVDFALRKPRCDVLLNASAHAPEGKPTRRVEVAAHIGSLSKSFAVVGDRVWDADGVGIRASSPIPFVTKLINYDRAFGGADRFHADANRHAAYMANPSGRGFHSQLVKEWVHGTALPNTEEIGRPVTNANGNYMPMSFGVIGRHWSGRAAYSGTYDQTWLDQHFPFLPPDFDDQYYQAAPLDQQMPIPVGRQQVTLINLTPEGRCDFTLPDFDAPVSVIPRTGERKELSAQTDTIVIEPDLNRVAMTWRMTAPLKSHLSEIALVLVGRRGSEWWQERGPFPVPIVSESSGAGASPPTEGA